MFEESASSLWTFMGSLFTPTVLFVLLNVMIGTIAFTSKFTHQKQPQNRHQTDSQNEPKISRSSSVLQRLKSINFYRSQEPQNLSLNHKTNPESDSLFNLEISQSQIFEQKYQETQTHFDFEQKDSNSDDFQQTQEERDEIQSMDEVYSELTSSHVSRTKSDTEPASGEMPAKLPARMRKSASLKSPFGHFEEEDMEKWRPATVRVKGSGKVADGDEEVDAKADDFINRFKQQLKLQRLDSIVRYKDMIGKGTGGS